MRSPKFTVKASGKNSQYGPSEVKSEAELIGTIVWMVQHLLNPCFEKQITVEIKSK